MSSPTGYTLRKIKDLKPGWWVFETPRDKQVLSIENRLEPGMQTAITFTDLTQDIFDPFGVVPVQRPLLKFPRFALAPYTDRDRLTNYLEGVVVPFLRYERRGYYGQGLLGLFVDYELDDIPWGDVVNGLHKHRGISRMLYKMDAAWVRGSELLRQGVGGTAVKDYIDGLWLPPHKREKEMVVGMDSTVGSFSAEVAGWTDDGRFIWDRSTLKKHGD